MDVFAPTSKRNSSSSARLSAVRPAKLGISDGGFESLHGASRCFYEFAHVLRFCEVCGVVQCSGQTVLAGTESLDQTAVGILGGVFHPLNGVLQGLSVAQCL